MENYALQAIRLILTLEGATGVALNIALLYSLLQRADNISSNKNIYNIPIFISLTQGGLLSFAIAVMNYVHIFREGTFIVAMLGPLVPYVPFVICNVGAEICFILTTMMWTMIPSTATMQFIALSRSHWSTEKRVITSFSFTIICIIFIGALTPDFIPTPPFYEFIDQIARDLYKVSPSQAIVVVGSTVTRPELNDNRSMIRIIIFFVIIPYAASYAYFIAMVYQIRKRLKNYGVAVSERTNRMQKSLFQMQMLQGFLPLAFISIPFVVFIVGAIFQANLDFATLLFTITIWFCPIIQAFVQLRFVRESNTKSSTEVTKISSRHSSNKKNSTAKSSGK